MQLFLNFVTSLLTQLFIPSYNFKNIFLGNADNPGIIPLSLHLFFASIEDQLLDKVFFKPDKFSGIIALNESEIKKELEIKERLLSACNQEVLNFIFFIILLYYCYIYCIYLLYLKPMHFL